MVTELYLSEEDVHRIRYELERGFYRTDAIAKVFEIDVHTVDAIEKKESPWQT